MCEFQFQAFPLLESNQSILVCIVYCVQTSYWIWQGCERSWHETEKKQTYASRQVSYNWDSPLNEGHWSYSSARDVSATVYWPLTRNLNSQLRRVSAIVVSSEAVLVFFVPPRNLLDGACMDPDVAWLWLLLADTDTHLEVSMHTHTSRCLARLLNWQVNKLPSMLHCDCS